MSFEKVLEYKNIINAIVVLYTDNPQINRMVQAKVA